MIKKHKLLDAYGSDILSGNSKAKIYGQFTCSAANRALAKGYASHRRGVPALRELLAR